MTAAGTDSVHYCVPELVRFDNAVAVRSEGERCLDQADGPVRISLGRLAEMNSIVVALLVAWVRHARGRRQSVQIVDVPEDLRNIMDLYGVGAVLPLAGSGAGTAWTVADESTGAGTGSGEQV